MCRTLRHRQIGTATWSSDVCSSDLYVPSFNGGFGGEKVQVYGNRAYFVSTHQINVLDVSNPQAPTDRNSDVEFRRVLFRSVCPIVQWGIRRREGSGLREPRLFCLDSSNKRSGCVEPSGTDVAGYKFHKPIPR